MNGPVWIEQLNSLHRVTARTRCAGDTLRIGRGYNNDLVLDDPWVAQSHLIIRIDTEGGITVQAEGAQTLTLEDNRTPLHEARIDGNSILQIGHTRLRVRTANYQRPELAVQPRPAHQWLYAIGAFFLLATLLLLALDQWLTDANASPYWRVLPEKLPALMVILIWAGAWALISRLLGHRGRFSVHLLIAAIGMFFIALLDNALGPVLFGLSLSPPVYLQLLLTTQMAVLVVYTHLSALGERFQPLPLRYLAIGMLALGITVAANEYIEQVDKGSIPNVVVAYPPELSVVGAQPLEKILEEINSLEKEARSTLNEQVPEKLR